MRLIPRRLLAIALTVLAGAATVATANGTSSVVLGSAAFAPHGEGWGTTRPPKLFNGGDPSGLVTHIHWASWGGSTAIGYGLNPIFKPGGGYYSHMARIELRAHTLGKCSSRGPRAYTQLSFRVPSRPGGPLGPWEPWSGAKSVCKFL